MDKSDQGKVMCYRLPLGHCPNCGHSQFIIIESYSTEYLTDNGGCVIDVRELDSNIVGKCCKCGKVYNMLDGYNKFIPLTPLRSLLYTYTGSEYDDTDDILLGIRNPMALSDG